MKLQLSFVILTILLVRPAAAGQYAKTDTSSLGVDNAFCVSRDGSIVVGRANWQGHNGRAAFWRQSTGVTYLDSPTGDFLESWIQHITPNNNMLFTQGASGSPELWSYDLASNSYSQLPNADFGTHGGNMSIHRIKDSNTSGSLLGYTTFGFDFGPSVEEPTVWRKENGVWSAHWITDTSGFVYSLDEAGVVYGQSSSGRASIWDSNLVRTDLPMPTGFTTGKAQGRLSDGRILGQLRNSAGWHIAIWSGMSSVPTTTFFGSPAQIEAPAMGSMDLLLITESGSPRQSYTWTPQGGKVELGSEVLGSLPTNRSARYIGDGGHLIVSTLDGGAKTWLLTPVPEPGSWITLGVGPMAILLKRRRKMQRRSARMPTLE